MIECDLIVVVKIYPCVMVNYVIVLFLLSANKPCVFDCRCSAYKLFYDYDA